MNDFEVYSPFIASDKHIALAPPSIDIMYFSNRLLDKEKHPNTSLALQDISPFPAGAYTGALGTKNVEGYNISHVVVGHSERRKYFHETNQEIANKVREALSASITPIVCVSKDTLLAQANSIEEGDRKRVIVAFEPIDHIGTGIADTLEDILKVKTLVKEAFGSVPFIYGGSVDSHTSSELLKHPDIDGFLVGTASLNAREFIKLLQIIS